MQSQLKELGIFRSVFRNGQGNTLLIILECIINVTNKETTEQQIGIQYYLTHEYRKVTHIAINSCKGIFI